MPVLILFKIWKILSIGPSIEAFNTYQLLLSTQLLFVKSGIPLPGFGRAAACRSVNITGIS